jgi:hypothetical protein
VPRSAATTAFAALVSSLGGTAFAASSREPTTVIVEVDRGFHWLDAGIGAAAVLALIALGCGLVLLRRTAVRAQPERRSDG